MIEDEKRTIQREIELAIISNELKRFQSDLLIIWKQCREEKRETRCEVIEALFHYLDGRLSDCDIEIFEMEMVNQAYKKNDL